MTLENNSTTANVQSWFIPIDILNNLCTAIAVLLALVFLFIIIFHKLYHNVPMLLVSNSCLAELIFESDLLAMGYISYLSVGIQNYSYLLQAIYRYILIVYPSRLFYQSAKFQTFLISITWICCIIYPIPLVFTGQINIILIYLKMVQYVQEMSKKVTPVNRLFHARRDLRMIRRIVSLVFILIALGFPYQTFIIMSFFNSAPKYHFRIAFMFIDVSLVFVLIALLEITEPLKTSLMKKINGRPINVIRTVT
ncbi:unnamed protein product [Rotaria sp. Silwood1]|nr:unnamed protein product [Rotaria sp. Silwood1]